MELFTKLAMSSGGLNQRLLKIDFYGGEGLMTNMFYVFLTDAIIGPLKILFNFEKLKKFMDRLKLKKLKSEKTHLPQKEANE